MKSRIFLIALLSAIVAFVSACNSKRPTPSDTAFKPGTQNADWLAATKIYGEGARDLTLRDSCFITADSQLIENLLSPVYFDTDKSSIAESERAKVDEASEYMKGNAKDKLLIEGYCDWRGTREYNLALGDRRANAVRQRLIDLGVDPARMQTRSEGDLKAQENASPETMKQDRKAAFIVVR